MNKLSTKNILIGLSILFFILILYFSFRLFGFFSFKFLDQFRSMAFLYSSIQLDFVEGLLRMLNSNYTLDQIEVDHILPPETKNSFLIYFSMLYVASIPFVSLLWFLQRKFLVASVQFLSSMVLLTISGTLIILLLICSGISNPLYQYFWTNFLAISISISLVFYILNKKEPSRLFVKLVSYSKVSYSGWVIRLKILFIVPLFKLIINLITVNFLIQIVLIPSKWITKLLRAETWIEGVYLWSARTYVYVSYSCLGLGAMFMFALFILMLKGGTWMEKTRFILMGLGIIIIVNIIRISALFMYYHHNYGENVLGIDTHDMFNIAIYVTIFVLWIVWIRRREVPVVSIS